jgi:hypothetical protein
MGLFSKLKGLKLSNIGTGKNLRQLKKLNFGDVAKMGLMGAGGMGLLSQVGGLKGLGGLAKTLGPKGLTGLLGMFGGGGGGGNPTAAYQSFEDNPFFQQLMDQQQNQLKMQQDYMNPNSAYNQLQKGEMMDTIAMNNQLQNRNLAKGGIDPSGGIGLQMNQDALNKGANQFMSNVGNRTSQGFNMGQQNYGNMQGMFENEQNRMNANMDLQSMQSMMNQINNQGNYSNMMDSLPGLLNLFPAFKEEG